jgi:hypothetical protein
MLTKLIELIEFTGFSELTMLTNQPFNEINLSPS